MHDAFMDGTGDGVAETNNVPVFASINQSVYVRSSSNLIILHKMPLALNIGVMMLER